jgi:hypothetical protein
MSYTGNKHGKLQPTCLPPRPRSVTVVVLTIDVAPQDCTFSFIDEGVWCSLCELEEQIQYQAHVQEPKAHIMQYLHARTLGYVRQNVVSLVTMRTIQLKLESLIILIHSDCPLGFMNAPCSALPTFIS